MTYTDFKSTIQADLRKHADGKTWKELKADLRLSYASPCPEWTKRLEREIGLIRKKGKGKAHIWRLP
jgi:hypothetical protein